jgi:hypothetical protein
MEIKVDKLEQPQVLTVGPEEFSWRVNHCPKSRAQLNREPGLVEGWAVEIRPGDCLIRGHSQGALACQIIGMLSISYFPVIQASEERLSYTT